MGFEIWLLAVELALIASLLLYTLLTGISPVPSTRAARAAILALAPPRLQGRILELGSGWGALAFALARRYPHCTVDAFEFSPVPWFYARCRLWLQPCPNLRLHRADFRRRSLAGASLVVCYLFPRGMAALREQFARDLPAGAVVISNTFEVPGWDAQLARLPEGEYADRIYRYRLPECVSGPLPAPAAAARIACEPG